MNNSHSLPLEEDQTIPADNFHPLLPTESRTIPIVALLQQVRSSAMSDGGSTITITGAKNKLWTVWSDATLIGWSYTYDGAIAIAEGEIFDE